MQHDSKRRTLLVQQLVQRPDCMFHRMLCHPFFLQLEVEDLKHKKLRLRSVILGQKVEKQVGLINRSSVDVTFTLLVTNTLLHPGVGLSPARSLSLSRPSNQPSCPPPPLVVPQELTVSPTGELHLKANGGSCKIYILFTPINHTPFFSSEVQADCAGLLLPLLTVQGCCQVSCRRSS